MDKKSQKNSLGGNTMKTLNAGETVPEEGTFFPKKEMVVVSAAMKLAKEYYNQKQKESNFKREYPTFTNGGIRV